MKDDDENCWDSEASLEVAVLKFVIDVARREATNLCIEGEGRLSYQRKERWGAVCDVLHHSNDACTRKP